LLSVVINFDIDWQYACMLGACVSWLLMVDLRITGRLLIGMGKQPKACEA